MKLLIFPLFFTLWLPSNVMSQLYFQQEVNHAITVKLDDITHTLSGTEVIEYINHSPDTLNYIVFHLWPNAYKNNKTAFARQQLALGSTKFHFAPAEQRGFIDSLDFTVNGQTLRWGPDKENSDICKVFLNGPLDPGDTVFIETPFFVKLPGTFSRLGHSGQSYQITQWFPKPAVYDRNGWNPMPYLDMGEFYSEYGSYNVSITLPKNYVVAATGNLLNTEELAWLDEKACLSTDSEKRPANNVFTPSQNEYKTLHYHADNVHDFAWFADKRYIVEKDEISLSGGRKVTTWAMYLPSNAAVWENATEYVGNAIRYYSAWYGEYPYDNCSAVKGAISAGGAMEYPTITVVGNTATADMLENYIVHEVGHNWFYGILGFNERRYPYLDEGLNTFSDFRYTFTKYPDKKLYEEYIGNEGISRLFNINDLLYGSVHELQYLLPARMRKDQPMNLHSELYTDLNYAGIVYSKSALAFTYLLNYLGEEKFNEVMQTFYETWKFKHPGPDDLRRTFENHCEKDLSWFFDALIPTSGIIDYKLKKIKGDSILVKNKGDIASPVCYSSIYPGKSATRQWEEGFTGKKWLPLKAEPVNKVILFDSLWLPEWNRKNDARDRKGLCKGSDPLELHPFQFIEKPDRTQIGIMPALGWNYYNKLMLGVFLYSPLLPRQIFEYQLAPMFGFGNNNIAGIGSIGLNFHPQSSVLQSFQIKGSAMRFGNDRNSNEGYGNAWRDFLYNLKYCGYNRARLDLLFDLKKPYQTSPVQHSIRLSLIGADMMGDFVYGKYFFKMYYGILEITRENKNILAPYAIKLNAEANENYLKAFLEFRYTHAARYASDALQIRIFGGSFILKDKVFSPVYHWYLSGTNGSNDYKFEQLYLGRFEKISDDDRQVLLSQQFTADQGGFAAYYPFARSDTWIASIGIQFRIPRLPVYLYANTGTYANAGKNEMLLGETMISSVTLPYETGLMVGLGKVLRIYLPLKTSPDIRKVSDYYFDNYWQTIRYTINLNAINPFAIKEKLL